MKPLVRYRNALAVAAASCAMLVVMCGKDYEFALLKGARIYREGKKEEGLRAMEESIVRGSADASFDTPAPEGDAVLYRKTKSGITALYPVDAVLKGIPDFDAIACDGASGMTALARGDDLLRFGPGGKFISSDALPRSGEKERRARALAWIDGDLMVFADGRLYRYNPGTRAFTPVLPRESFLPPYGDSGYRASFRREGPVLLLAAGLGGQYHLSAINIGKDGILFKNKPVSSSRMLLVQDRLYYIAGTAGAWTLAAYSLESKAVRELAVFGDLADITFLTRGVLYETREGLFLADYAHPSMGVQVPFTFRPRGRSGAYILMEWEGSLFLTDEKRLLGLINLAQKELPLVFTTKSETRP